MGPVKQAFRCHDASFCPGCGALLPPLPPTGHLHCLACRKEIPVSDQFDEEASTKTYTIVFNKRQNLDPKKKKKGKDSDDEDEVEGPTIERTCPKCGCEKMSYAALQLRSADEGQTVFFTCIKCKYKESENS